jgi:hypothetical protein
MQIKFLSVEPQNLIKDQLYLVGQVSLVDEIDWYTALFDGSLFHFLENNGDLIIKAPDKFLFSLSGYETNYLIFQLPQTGIELENLL